MVSVYHCCFPTLVTLTIYTSCLWHRDNVYCSNVVKNNLNPAWEDATVELSTLCNGDLDKAIQVVVYDYESSGKHVLMVQFETSVNGLLHATKGSSADMGKAVSMKIKGRETSKIVVLKAEVASIQDVTKKMATTSVGTTRVSHSHYTTGNGTSSCGGRRSLCTTLCRSAYVCRLCQCCGCKLQVCIAVDFTGSNGKREQMSAH